MRTPLSIAVALLPQLAVAQTVPLPADSVLDAVTARGRALAAYDQAAWHATDAVLALKPDLTAANTMLALQQPDGHWVVHFARLNAAQDSLVLVFEAVEAGRSDSFLVHTRLPPAPLPDSELRAARAIRTAGADLGSAPEGPFNSYFLPRTDGSFWVYFLPAQQDAREVRHGADVRYLVSPDGRRILDKHRMHRALLNAALPDSAVTGWHTVITEDLPQDSDVFLVLTRTPRRPELIATEHFFYTVAVTGAITCVRRN